MVLINSSLVFLFLLLKLKMSIFLNGVGGNRGRGTALCFLKHSSFQDHHSWYAAPKKATCVLEAKVHGGGLGYWNWGGGGSHQALRL